MTPPQPESDRLVIQREASGPKHSYELSATLGAGSLMRHLVWAAFHRQGEGGSETWSPVCLVPGLLPVPHLVLPVTADPVTCCGFEGMCEVGRVREGISVPRDAQHHTEVVCGCLWLVSLETEPETGQVGWPLLAWTLVKYSVWHWSTWDNCWEFPRLYNLYKPTKHNNNKQKF